METKDFQNEFERAARIAVEELGFARPSEVVIVIPDFPNDDVFVHDVEEINVGPNGEIAIRVGGKLSADELNVLVPRPPKRKRKRVKR